MCGAYKCVASSFWLHPENAHATFYVLQSFFLPTSVRGFYRYIRIDFLSHYGSEYYCPISLLRVYGLTHLEEWQWETWETEARAKAALVQVQPPAVKIMVERPVVVSAIRDESLLSDKEPAVAGSHKLSTSTSGVPSEANYTAEGATEAAYVQTKTTVSPHHDNQRASATLSATADLHVSSTSIATHTEKPTGLTTTSYVSTKSMNSTVSSSLDHSSQDTKSTHNAANSISAHPSSSLAPSKPNPSTPSLVPTVTTLLVASSIPLPPPAGTPSTGSPPLGGGGESIYRTIMNRLSALEANTTLYARFVEEHAAGVRDALRRMAEDIGRLEGATKAQTQAFQRSLGEMERQRKKVEAERGELLRRVNYLADEVSMRIFNLPLQSIVDVHAVGNA
jgi:hypothetical protein